MEKFEKKISFVIPCYHSENTIEAVVEDICKEFPSEEYNKEIVLVNDGSRDGTYAKLRELADKNSEVVAINLSKNFGQDGATMCGLSQATGEYIIVLDDDGQNPPYEAHKLLEQIEKGYDAVFGKYRTKKDTLFKKFGHDINDMMATSFIGKPKSLQLNSYFVINRFVRDEMLKYKGAYPYIWGLILRCTDNTANVYVEHKAREEGKSTYTLSKLLNLWFDGFISFSVKPLRLTSCLGFVSCIMGFLLTGVIIIKTIHHGDVPGWPTMMAATLVLGGLQMLMVGIVGEYVGRIFINGNHSPQFVIREKYQKEEQE
ncbi:undecaprenyl-phosphate 4-deoxy-4-formamido-L-arabinose transferase [Pseudobutyrivibrio sp. C4]|uniref:glycosyltransferase family 2 protein n=1 Tax=Pseudobutyrivibrio sp. C4 TaxID=1520803 RepID=UPI0008BBB2B4|nr:glycosyltransferase family 2 protein [Pseudobutyrivibrio sp. C4]SET26299.1 undecaprenyl-phosphate 4-deoxy-4-formamido-L-arabinose transferase [Pseudobutyrivibrio sp. C4]